jgi:CheY-like chemotaxis protein
VYPAGLGGKVKDLPRVLIVEDDPVSLDVARLAVEAAGAAALVATSGEEALKVALEEMPDMILLDLALPGIDGSEVARRLREDEQTREIPVVVVTAHVVREVIERARREGVRECIFKPYRIHQLQSVITRYLPETVEMEGASSPTREGPPAQG